MPATMLPTHAAPDARPDRIGKFALPSPTTNRHEADSRVVLRDCVVVRAETLYERGLIQYTALHPSFDAIAPGDDLPEYVANVTTGRCTCGTPMVTAVEWLRKDTLGALARDALKISP